MRHVVMASDIPPWVIMAENEDSDYKYLCENNVFLPKEKCKNLLRFKREGEADKHLEEYLKTHNIVKNKHGEYVDKDGFEIHPFYSTKL